MSNARSTLAVSLFILLAIFLLSLHVAFSSASASNIIVADVFWGELHDKLEVNPGDKNMPLTVQLINARKEQIIGIRGYLILPKGFVDSLTDSRQTRESAYTQAVPSGGSFTLKYLIDIDESVSIGLHKGYAVIQYLYYDKDEDELVSSLSYVPIDIRVTGKSHPIIDVEDGFLTSGIVNRAMVKILNDGTGDIYDAYIQIGEPDVPGITIFDTQRSLRLSRISAGSYVLIPINLNVESSIKNVAFRIPVSLSYLDAYGQQKILKQNLMLRVGSENVERIIIDVSVEDSLLLPSSTNTVKLFLRNIGNEPAMQLEVEVVLPQSLPAPLIFVKESGKWSIDRLDPGEIKILNLDIFASRHAAGSSFTITLKVSYSDIYNNRYLETRSIGVRVADEPTMKSFKITSIDSLTSGKINTVSIKIENLKSEVLKNVSITLEPSIDWLTILKGDREYYEEFLPNEIKDMTVSIFIPEQTRERISTVGNAVHMLVRVEYTDSSGTFRNEVYRLGYYVKGMIDITLQELYIEIINERFYLVGRLLNEGNEPALFTKVSLIGAPEGLVALRSVYLGDLNPNAPLMFNIPIMVIGNLSGKEVDLTLIVEYKDSLRQNNSKVFNIKVFVPETQASIKRAESYMPFISMPMLATIGAIIFIAVIVVVIFRVRKRRGLSIQSGMPSEV